jgi:hypothetical protein
MKYIFYTGAVLQYCQYLLHLASHNFLFRHKPGGLNLYVLVVLFLRKLIVSYMLKAKAVPLHATKTLGGEEVQLLLILDLGTRWGWVASVMPRPRFILGERTPGTHWTGGWVDPRAGLAQRLEEKSFHLCWGSNLNSPVVQPLARHYTDWATRITVSYMYLRICNEV